MGSNQSNIGHTKQPICYQKNIKVNLLKEICKLSWYVKVKGEINNARLKLSNEINPNAITMNSYCPYPILHVV